jgi:hypothetical protein
MSGVACTVRTGTIIHINGGDRKRKYGTAVDEELLVHEGSKTFIRLVATHYQIMAIFGLTADAACFPNQWLRYLKAAREDATMRALKAAYKTEVDETSDVSWTPIVKRKAELMRFVGSTVDIAVAATPTSAQGTLTVMVEHVHSSAIRVLLNDHTLTFLVAAFYGPPPATFKCRTNASTPPYPDFPNVKVMHARGAKHLYVQPNTEEGRKKIQRSLGKRCGTSQELECAAELEVEFRAKHIPCGDARTPLKCTDVDAEEDNELDEHSPVRNLDTALLDSAANE